MGKGRLEAFSDGVIAVIITIMVLELKAPHGDSLRDLAPVAPVLLTYVLSFVFVGIYWNNHHHLMHAARSITGPIMWANLHLLFWLSLVPFVTSWMGENNFIATPVALYGVVLLMNAVAFTILSSLLVRHEGPQSTLAKAVGKDRKGKVSLLIYLVGLMAAFVAPAAAIALYVAVALIWLIPDRRIEQRIAAP